MQPLCQLMPVSVAYRDLSPASPPKTLLCTRSKFASHVDSPGVPAWTTGLCQNRANNHTLYASKALFGMTAAALNVLDRLHPQSCLGFSTFIS
ncbi:hypothetical protein ABBQ38_009071 [Trebouxia sp. C0009 RCD-2024]